MATEKEPTAAKKSAAKKPAAKKSAPAKKPVAKKTAAPAAKKATPAKKTAAKKAPAKKATPAKKTAAPKKQSAKKTAAPKKQSAKKTAAPKKQSAKKSAPAESKIESALIEKLDSPSFTPDDITTAVEDAAQPHHYMHHTHEDQFHGQGDATHSVDVTPHPTPTFRERFITKRNLMIALAVLALLVIWNLAATGLSARANIAEARTNLASLATTDELTAAQLADLLADTRAHADAAYEDVHTPLWSVVSAIPLLGNAADATMVSTEVARDLLSETSQIESELRALPKVEGNALLDPGLIEVLGKAAKSFEPGVNQALEKLANLDLTLVPAQVTGSLNEVINQLQTAKPYLSQASSFAEVAPVLLGLEKPTEWLVVFTSGAEARPAGGFPGGWGIVTADRGRLTLTNLETNDRLSRATLSNYEELAGEDATILYGSDLSRVLDMGLSPDFELTGKLHWNLYRQETPGVLPAGVLQMDEHALAYLMQVTGPVQVGKTEVTSQTAVDYITKTVYSEYPNVEEKDAALLGLTRDIFKKLQTGEVGVVGLAKALLPSIDQNRLRAWAWYPATQKKIAATALGGQIADTQSYSHIVAVANGGGNKLEAYIDYAVEYIGGQCNLKLPYRDSTMRITINNSAPPRGLPAYVTPRTDLGNPAPKPQGGTRELIYVHVPLGSEFTSVEVDGQSGLEYFAEGIENNRWVWRFDVEVDAQSSRVIVLKFSEPALEKKPFANVWQQPMTLPMKVSAVPGPACLFGN